MKSKYITKVLLLVAITILLVGLVSATTTNKTSTTKDTKVVKDKVLDAKTIKDTQKPIKTQEKKALKTSSKITDKCASVNTNQKVKSTDNNKSSSERIIHKNSTNLKTDVTAEYYDEYRLDDCSTIKLTTKRIGTNKYNLNIEVKNGWGNYVREGTAYIYDNFEPYEVDDSIYSDTYEVNYKNGKGTYTLTLSQGRHTIYAYIEEFIFFSDYGEEGVYYSDEICSISTNDIKLEYNYIKVSHNIPSELDISKTLNIEASVYEDDTGVNNGNVSLYLDNTLQATKIPSYGIANFNINFKNPGTHTLKVQYVNSYGETYKKTATIDVTRKTEKITLSMPSKADTDNSITIKADVKNDTDNLKVGNLIVKFDGNQIAYKKVSGSTISLDYILPTTAGTYPIVAEYQNNGKTVTKTSRTITVTDAESLTFNPSTSTVTDAEKTLTATITSSNGKVNHGQIKITFNGKTIINTNVKNNKVSKTIKIPRTAGKYKTTATYIKEGKTIESITKTIKVTNAETLKYSPPTSTKTDAKKTFTATITSSNGKVNHGQIKITLNGKTIINTNVKNNKVSKTIKIPRTAGKYKTTATYIKEGKTIVSITKTIKVTDAETLKYKPISAATTDSKKKFTATVTSPNGKVNFGKIKITLNGKTIINSKVKNGKVSKTIKMPNKAGTYKTSASYIKDGKTIKKISKKIKVKDSESINFKPPNKVTANKKYTSIVKVTSPNGKVNTGTVRIKIGGGKLLATKKVKNGVAKITYKIPNYKEDYEGDYLLTAEYVKYGKKIKSAGKYIYVAVPVKTYTTTLYLDQKSKHLGMGDYAYSFVEYYDQQYRKGAYVHIGADGDLVPYYYRLTKAVFYHKSYSTGNVIQKTVTANSVTGYSELGNNLINGYKPVKVQIYYRRMTYDEKLKNQKESLYYGS